MATFTIKIRGEAGQGLVSVGNILLKAIAKEGWYLFSHQDYESRIRGGQNYFNIRLADHPVYSGESQANIFVALDNASVDSEVEELKDDGIIIYDPDQVGDNVSSANSVAIGFQQVAKDQGQPKVMANAAAAGGIWAFLAEDTGNLETVLKEMFEDKGEEIVAGNLAVARAGFEIAKDTAAGQAKPDKQQNTPPRLLLKGNEALALGALAGGLKFMSAYPMTPSTGVTEFVASQAKNCSVVMEQAEDEISAINMSIGAAYTGVRAMTATSGGGFALMTEALGLAGSAEIPIVVIDAQRPGPSTGLPTRTEQGDLLYALGTSSGDFPKAILAPGDPEEAFYLMNQAFNLAEEYQMPVIVLSDQHLADSHETIHPVSVEQIKINRGRIVAPDQASDGYKRYAYTKSGISPRLYPGAGRGLVVSAGDEHDEEGHLIEDRETRIKMMEKRMAKMEGVRKEVLPPVIFGDLNGDIILIGWGSTKGSLRETVQILQARGLRASGVHLPQVYPLPPQLAEIMEGPGKKYVIEGNYSGQLEKLIAMELAVRADGHVRRYDGRPLNPSYILENLAGGVYCD